MEQDGVEMKTMSLGRADEEMASSEKATEPLDWARSRVRTQNRCFTFFLLAMAVATAAYVLGGVSLEDEKARMEEYDAQSGVLTNDYDNAKSQEIAEKKDENKVHAGNWFAKHNAKNPFGNDNAEYHGAKNVHQPTAKQLARWNHTHPGVPYPSHTQGLNHQQQWTHGNKGGSAGHDGGHSFHGHDGKNKQNHGKASNCENLSQYKDWFKATVSKSDGKMYEIVKRMDHDKHAFTQGLTFHHGHLWESTGLYGQSTVRILDPETAKVIHKEDMESKLFGEGMTWMKGDKLVQITWKSKRGFIYDPKTLEQIDEFQFTSTKNEGWGITWDACNEELIMTDGSPYLHFWDASLKERRKVAVTRMNGNPAKELNEIEFWRGRVLANVWYEDVLLVIDPKTGRVEKEYDFSDLWKKSNRKMAGADVFNGISVSADPDILYVTGKKWDRMFKIKLLH